MQRTNIKGRYDMKELLKRLIFEQQETYKGIVDHTIPRHIEPEEDISTPMGAIHVLPVWEWMLSASGLPSL